MHVRSKKEKQIFGSSTCMSG